MTTEKVVVASNMPSIDRGTDARAKVSRKRFLALAMVGIMIVSAISMIAPDMIDNNSQDEDSDQIAKTSWNPAGAREAVYKFYKAFESTYRLDNWTKAAHNNGIGTRADFLGTHGTRLGVNGWLNGTLRPERLVRTNYPYILYRDLFSNAECFPTPPLPVAATDPALGMFAPITVKGVVRNDTYLRTGNSEGAGTSPGRNVPFIPWMNHSTTTMTNGGRVNITLYASYVNDTEQAAITQDTLIHYAKWFYKVPQTTIMWTGDTVGYWYEIHGTVVMNKSALQTFLNYTPGVRSRNRAGAPLVADELDPVAWFTREKGTYSATGIPTAGSLTEVFYSWIYDNFSAPAAGKPNAYFRVAPTNGNIYSLYGSDMYYDYAGNDEAWAYLSLDPCRTVGAWNYSGNMPSGDKQLAIRVYYCAWAVDCALTRMMGQANLGGNVDRKDSGTTGLYANRPGSIIPAYAENVRIQCNISRSMANSSWQATGWSLKAWEDPSGIMSGGWQLDVGSSTDFYPAVLGAGAVPAMTSYVVPLTKYRGVAGVRHPGDTANDVVSLTYEKTTNWRGPGSRRYNLNASIVSAAPQIMNLTAYEAIIVDLNTNARASGQVLGHQGYRSDVVAIGAPKVAEYGRWSYWGKLKLGQGCYPQAQILAGYNAGTRILNLSGGTTGMAMALVNQVDYWGARAGQANRIYMRGMPSIQLDVAAVDHLHVTLQNQSLPLNHKVSALVEWTEWVKVTPHNATDQIPRNWGGAANGRYFCNDTIQLSYNRNFTGTQPSWTAGSLANGSLIQLQPTIAAGGNAWTKVTFRTADDNAYINATDVNFTFAVGSYRQNQTGSFGPFIVYPIPEFATVLIPIVGMMAMFFVIRATKVKRKREE